MLIKPAVEGVENVLMSALNNETLEKVVVTSSIAAVVGRYVPMPPGYLYSEADWNEITTKSYLPYNRYQISAMLLIICEMSCIAWKLCSWVPGSCREITTLVIHMYFLVRQEGSALFEDKTCFVTCRSKTLAEQRAFEISATPGCKWNLATICPAVVQGPLAGN